MNNNLLKISKILLYLVPFSLIWVYQGTVFPFIVGKYVFFRTIVGLSAIFYLWGWVVEGQTTNRKTLEKKQLTLNNLFSAIKKQPLISAVLAFTFIYVLAGFFGVNPSASFWSNFERGEGGLQITFLSLFFILLGLNFKDEKLWRKMLVVSVWSAVLVILYGVIAAMGFKSFVGSSLCLRFSGSLGNPAYTGTFLIFAIFYALYLFAEDFKKNKKWLWIGLSSIFFIFLLLTQTRGALLGLGIAAISGLFYLFFVLPKGKFKIVSLVTAFSLIGLGILGYNFRQSINIMPFCSEESGGGNRILDVNFGTETFQTRLLLWKESISAFKERPIFGWGPENFTVAFEKYYRPEFTTWYDRAHNIFFDYLVMTGLLGLLSFIGIFGVYYWQFFKLTHNEKQITNNKNQLPVISYQLLVSNTLLFALPIAYLVQGLVLFDVLSIYINLFVFLAFANWKFNNFNK